MSVHKNKDGRWFVQYKAEGYKSLKRKYFGFGIEAEQKARAFNESLGLRPWKRRTPKKQSPRFKALADAYLAAKTGQMSGASIDNLLWKLEGVILPTLGEGIQAVNVTPARLDRYVEKRKKRGIKFNEKSQ